ncbi:MAG: hypothetical protein P8077_03960 [Gammaproteobacteria bacterium]
MHWPFCPLIKRGLETWEPIANRWELVWGPAVYRFPLAIFDDNLMFVVKDKTTPDTYAIVLRGTNPVAVSDWLFEDLKVRQLIPWPTTPQTGKLNPKISQATHIGLQILKNMIATTGTPGAGEDLKVLLRRIIADKTTEQVDISVTGHSLAGALAPLLALWLADTQGEECVDKHEQWDTQRVTKLSCTAFAGPSPGNKDFTAYYDRVIGQQTQRIHNHLDVVPHAWAQSTMKGLLSLYKGTASPNLLLIGVYYYFLLTTRHLNYEQIKPETPAFLGTINSKLKNFIEQMIDQHTMGYLNEYNISECVGMGALKELWSQPSKKRRSSPLATSNPEFNG